MREKALKIAEDVLAETISYQDDPLQVTINQLVILILQNDKIHNEHDAIQAFNDMISRLSKEFPLDGYQRWRRNHSPNIRWRNVRDTFVAHWNPDPQDIPYRW